MVFGYLLVVILLTNSLSVESVDNGVGKTPQMGYNTWNDYRCKLDSNNIVDVINGFSQLGLLEIGYKYINIDDCWAKSRDSNGNIVPDPQIFPDGMAAVVEKVHQAGFLFGIYTDRGNMTCQERPGSDGYEEIDAKLYSSWGVDYLKEDSCYASDDHDVAFKQYGKMRDALNATGRPIFFSLCGWNSWYAPVGWSLGNSWRISGDCNSWDDVVTAINVNAQLAKYARPGGWNDPDMLLGSETSTAAWLPPTQSRTQFSMWCVMAAPLLLGTHKLNLFDQVTYMNPELIAVNQDVLGLQGIRLVGNNLTIPSSTQKDATTTTNIWGKKLSGKEGWAVIFINTGSRDVDITCDLNCFSQMGFRGNDLLKGRDLWLHEVVDKQVIPSVGYTAKGVVNGGGSTVIRFYK